MCYLHDYNKQQFSQILSQIFTISLKHNRSTDSYCSPCVNQDACTVLLSFYLLSLTGWCEIGLGTQPQVSNFWASLQHVIAILLKDTLTHWFPFILCNFCLINFISECREKRWLAIETSKLITQYHKFWKVP